MQTADALLSDFFPGRRAAARPGEEPVVRLIEADLRLAVELEGEGLLDGDGAVLLAAERQFLRSAAVGRVLGPVALVRVLERYLGNPRYRPRDRITARVRTETCAALLRALALQPELHGHVRLLRRADEAVRIEAGTRAVRRVRRVRS